MAYFKDAGECDDILGGFFRKTSESVSRGDPELVRIQEKLAEILEEPTEDRGGVLVKRLDTGYAVISTVTRRIAWGTGRDTIVVNTGFFPGHDQLYSRSSRLDMQPMIERARELGFNAGGKSDVLGAIVPKEETESFVEELLSFFKEK